MAEGSGGAVARIEAGGSMRWRGPPLKPGVPAILQVVPSLVTGGVERGACDIARAIEDAGLNAVVMSAGGPMADALVADGLRHVDAPVAAKNLLTMWRNAGRIARVAEATGAALIHARSRAPAWSALRAARRLGLPFVTTFHGTYNFGGNFKGGLKRRYNSVMARGDRVIAISEFIAGHIRAHYADVCPPERIRVIHRGIDLDVFDPADNGPKYILALRMAWGLDEPIGARPIVMLPGRLARWKGHAVLIHAMAALANRHALCLMVGGGNDAYRAEMEALAAGLGIGDRVRFVGDTRAMPAACEMADVVVSASTDPEAFGRVSVEAQAMQRPIVATAHGGAVETVIDLGAHPDTGTGWLVPPGDPAALAAALDTALALPPAARAAIGQRGRANAQARFSKPAMCAATLAVYRELVPALRN